MKNTSMCITNVILCIIGLCGSGSMMAQTNANVNQSTFIVKAHGVYPQSATALQAISLIKNDSAATTTITPGDAVHFTSGKKIILSPGFKAENGSRFIADIKPQAAVINMAANDKLNKSVTISPNPFKNSFIVSVIAEQACKGLVTLYNSAGVKVKDQSDVYLLKGANTITINASGIASGAYMLEVNSGDAKIIKKIIKSD